MMRWLCAVIFIFFSLSAVALNWTNLWKTPDQQGQELMNKEQFVKAKEKFEAEDWRAAAAYKSGDYKQAADLYNKIKMKTAQNYFNAGNALAHLGQYEKALESYNKALALKPNDPDTKYNHKVVSELLKKNKEQQNKEQQNKEQQNKEQQNKEQQNKEQQNKEQQNKEQQNKEQQNKEQQNKEQQNKEQQNKEQQNKEQQNKEQQNKEQQNKEQENKEQQNKEQQNEEQQNKEQQNQEQQNEEQQNKKQQNKQKDNEKQQGDVQTREGQKKQQAKEQWLRLIPDDPGGLLREKFLRDHLRRERGWYQ